MPVLTVGDKRILYIHVPKTGGTSVEDLLRSYGGSLSMYAPSRGALPCAPQHFHGKLLETIFGSQSEAEGYRHDFDFVFMTVRHPISRLLSEYRYQRSITVRLKKNPIAQALTFDLWCRYVLLRSSRNPFYSDNHLRPQADFAVWSPAIYRLEDGLDQIRKGLDSLIGVPGEWPSGPRKVSTDDAGTADGLRPSTRRLIQKCFARDFEAYNYPCDFSG